MKARWERGQGEFSRSEGVHKAGVLLTFRKLDMKEERETQCGHKRLHRESFLTYSVVQFPLRVY